MSQCNRRHLATVLQNQMRISLKIQILAPLTIKLITGALIFTSMQVKSMNSVGLIIKFWFYITNIITQVEYKLKILIIVLQLKIAQRKTNWRWHMQLLLWLIKIWMTQKILKVLFLLEAKIHHHLQDISLARYTRYHSFY